MANIYTVEELQSQYAQGFAFNIRHQLDELMDQQSGGIEVCIVAENGQNAFDAKATIIVMTLTGNRFTYHDNGEGIDMKHYLTVATDNKLIQNETQGTHNIGHKGVGRLKMLHFGIVTVISSGIQLVLDRNVRTADGNINLMTMSQVPVTTGTTITIDFFPGQVIDAMAINTIVKNCTGMFIVPGVSISLNGVELNRKDIEFTNFKGDHMTVSMADNPGADKASVLYVQGMKVRELSRDEFVEGYVILSDNLNLTMGRNEIVTDDTSKEFFDLLIDAGAHAIINFNRTKQFPNLAVLYGAVITGKVTYEQVENLKCIKMHDGAYYSLKSFKETGIIDISMLPEGQRNGAANLLKDHKYGASAVIGGQLRAILNEFSISVRSGKAIIETDESLSELFNGEAKPVDIASLSKEKRMYCRIALACGVEIQRAYRWKLGSGKREISFVTGTDYHGCTDGKSWIKINKGTSIWTNVEKKDGSSKNLFTDQIFAVVFHEYVHNNDSSNESSHGAEYDNRYREWIEEDSHERYFEALEKVKDIPRAKLMSDDYED
jgi:hypothetical protein